MAKTAKVRIIEYKDTAFYQKQLMSKRIISKTTNVTLSWQFLFRFPNRISSDKIKITALSAFLKKLESVPFYESFSVIEDTNDIDRDEDDNSDG
jgi:hypothetical protein